MPQYTREFTRRLDAGSSPRLDIRTVDGPIFVAGEDRGDVLLSARVRFRAESDEEADELMRTLQFGVRVEGDRVVVHEQELEHGSGREHGRRFGGLRGLFGQRRHVEIDLDVRAPRGCSLSLHHVNGAIELRQIGGDVRVQQVNGRFEVTDVGGDLSFHHVNGRGLVRNVGGDVDIHYTNGALEVDRTGGDVSLRLVNGKVELREAGGRVSIKGVSGAYSYTGAVRGDVQITNAHGAITLEVPRGSRFELDAQSAMGTVSSELEVRDGSGAGSGAAPKVSLRSETGQIEVRALRQAEAAAV